MPLRVNRTAAGNCSERAASALCGYCIRADPSPSKVPYDSRQTCCLVSGLPLQRPIYFKKKNAPILRTPPTVSTMLLVPASHTSHTSRPHRPTVPFTHVFVSAIHRKPFGSIPRESSVCHSGPLNPKFIARRPCSAQCILPPPASSACLSCIPARRAPVESLSSCGPCPRSPPAPCPSPC